MILEYDRKARLLKKSECSDADAGLGHQYVADGPGQKR